MELQMFAARPISNPVIPSFNTITAYPIIPVYPIKEESTNPLINNVMQTANPIFTRDGTLIIPKKGAMYIKQETRTSTSKNISKSFKENVYSTIKLPIRDTY